MSQSKTSQSDESRTPKRRDREATEQKILQAGLEVFSELGYDCATTRLIAQRAGSNESLISRYFQSKEGLLLAIIVKYVNEKKTAQLGYPPCETLEDELCYYLRTKALQDIDAKDFIRIIVSRAAIDPQLNERIRNAVSHEPDPLLWERLKRLQNKGQLNKDADLDQICFAIGFQGFSTVFMAHIIMGKDKDATLQSLEQFARVYARGLR